MIEALRAYIGKRIMIKGKLSGVQRARTGVLENVWEHNGRTFIQISGVGGGIFVLEELLELKELGR